MCWTCTHHVRPSCSVYASAGTVAATEAELLLLVVVLLRLVLVALVLVLALELELLLKMLLELLLELLCCSYPTLVKIRQPHVVRFFLSAYSAMHEKDKPSKSPIWASVVEVRSPKRPCSAT